MYRDRVVRPDLRVLSVCVGRGQPTRAFRRGVAVVSKVLAQYSPKATHGRTPTVTTELLSEGWDGLKRRYDCIWFTGCTMMSVALGDDKLHKIEILRRALNPGGLVLFTQLPAYVQIGDENAVNNRQQLVAVEFMRFGADESGTFGVGSPEQLAFLAAWRAAFQMVATPHGPVYKAT